jgi:hypothetical protein
MIKGTKKQMFDEVIPPNMPSTDETLGNTMDKTHVAHVNPAQMMVLALLVNSVFPVIN